MEKTVKKPLQQRSQKRMEQVINSAKILLETYPIEQVSIPEIAKHSGVPRSSIYQFFPTMTILLNEITQQYMHQLLELLASKAAQYLTMPILEISKDLIRTTATFYNQNHLASVLILNGSLSAEVYKEQQAVIQVMAQNVVLLLKARQPPIIIDDHDPFMDYSMELTFAIMKYSYFKNGNITEAAQQEIIDINRIYLQHRGFA